MRKFINDYGCIMEFDDKISDEQIKNRLFILGKTAREIKDI